MRIWTWTMCWLVACGGKGPVDDATDDEPAPDDDVPTVTEVTTSEPGTSPGDCAALEEIGDALDDEVTGPLPGVYCGDWYGDGDVDVVSIEADRAETLVVTVDVPEGTEYAIEVYDDQLTRIDYRSHRRFRGAQLEQGRSYRVALTFLGGEPAAYELSLAVDEAYPDATDTGFYYVTTLGEATVSSESFAGYETVAIEAGNGHNLCQWTYEMFDTDGPGSDIPCADPDGNACDFAFEVERVNGSEGPQLAGSLCDALQFEPTGGVAGYGFTPSYEYNGAVVRTDAFMYLFDLSLYDPSLPVGSYYWVALSDGAQLEGDAFSYELPGTPRVWVPSTYPY